MKYFASAKGTSIKDVRFWGAEIGPRYVYLVNVKSTVKISSIFVAFLENMNFDFFNDFL